MDKNLPQTPEWLMKCPLAFDWVEYKGETFFAGINYHNSKPMSEKKIHEQKTWPEYFQEVQKGNKTFEIRKNDRDFKKGDILHLKEFEPMRSTISNPNDGYTGRELKAEVTYIITEPCFGIELGTCIMSIKLL